MDKVGTVQYILYVGVVIVCTRKCNSRLIFLLYGF